MAWGLELRVPLLDYRLVELAMRIPAAAQAARAGNQAHPAPGRGRPAAAHRGRAPR